MTEKNNEYEIEEGDTRKWHFVTRKKDGKEFSVEHTDSPLYGTGEMIIYAPDGKEIPTKEEHREISAVVSKYLEKKEQTIEIEVKGGTVVDVRNLPEGCNYEVSEVKAWNVTFIRSEIIHASTRGDVEEIAEHFKRKQEMVGSIEETNE